MFLPPILLAFENSLWVIINAPTNNKIDNIKIIILLYSIGVISGILLELIGIKF